MFKNSKNDYLVEPIFLEVLKLQVFQEVFSTEDVFVEM